MARTNNYLIQAAQAKARFLTYDQQKLIEKFSLDYDENYIYVNLLWKLYRICRATGDMAYRTGDSWADGNSYDEVMTILDLLCDSRDDRRPAGRLASMASFGRIFYRSSTEDRADPSALWIQDHAAAFQRACRACGGEALPGGDFGYAFTLFDELKLGFHFWEGDEEFAPRLRFLWDENALQYLRFETMHMAVSLLMAMLKAETEKENPSLP